jgi:hypothetical protein
VLPRRYRLMLALLVPALLLACRFSKTMLSPGTSVPVSQEAADRLEEKLGRLIQGEDNDAFSLQVTEAELTSYVVFKMAEQIDRPEELPLENFQAQFTGGQMLFSGKVAAVCPLCFDVQVAASAYMSRPALHRIAKELVAHHHRDDRRVPRANGARSRDRRCGDW